MHFSSRRRALGALTTVALVAGLVAAPVTAATASDDSSSDETTSISSFTLPVLPDTQFYSRYSASQFYPKYGTNPFEVQTSWLVENQDALNIPFVVHVGDVVDQNWVTTEWDAADKAMQILTDGGLPYSVIPGNHDTADMSARSSEANSWYYLQKFNAAEMAAQGGDTYVGSYQNGLSSAYIFEAEGYQWMSLALAWNASADTFAWAQGILDANPGIPVVLSSHAIINIDTDQVTAIDWGFGEELWDSLIRMNDQIILTVNGHFHGTTMRERTNDYGHTVYQVLTDYQMAADGGNGYMTTFEFDLTNSAIDVESISPWITVKDEDSLTSSDAPYLEGTWQSFSMAMDFEERFGYSAIPAEEDGTDLSELAKAIVSEGWESTAAGAELVAAGDSSDYIEVDGTIAHWRFGSVAEGVVDENTVIPDVAGESPMYRNAIENTDADEELDDVTITHTNVPYYSSDAGAVCFDDVHRNDSGVDTLSYITTEYGAPATFASLTADSGYTIETFLQLDEEWTETYNRWGAALARGGSREWIGIPDSSDAGASPMWIGISNLREYQYSAANSTNGASYTLWSGEIMQGAWHHVAIVNDPAADTAIMYVDGVPVLRNASSVGGMMAADFMPWIIGTSTWDTEPDHGWFGCVGETRIVDHALSTSEFLTSRVSIDGDSFSVTTDFDSVYAYDASMSEISGTGVAGTSARVELAGESLGTAEVASDGTWTVALSEPLAGTGSYSLTITPSIGSRDGDAVQAVLVIGERESWTPAEGDLVAGLENLITVSPNPFDPGDTVQIDLPAGHEGEDVYAFAFSDPTALGSATVGAVASVTVTIPTSLPLGSHRIALYSADGTLIGWQSVTVGIPTVADTAGAASDSSSTQGLATTGGTLAVIFIIGAFALAAVAAGAALRVRRRQV
ncbi:hypothetical protein GCM10009808_26040 [Microbacterium sediminicola]|uniref:Calcineurin-like phosphoesterase domain-containing protein n=1 Tax=Microbacterium sediminicola TaxID=415210 RepID=A0ABP4UJP2_9MICO